MSPYNYYIIYTSKKLTIKLVLYYSKWHVYYKDLKLLVIPFHQYYNNYNKTIITCQKNIDSNKKYVILKMR